MKNTTILIVEDERIVAKDLQQTLAGFGYKVPSIVSTGDEAIQAVEKLHPDLILMDIQLKGDLDGIATVTRIRKKHDVPVVYLTAFADEKTLKRAKTTQPFGYIIKPFDEREVHSTIEMALYKNLMEQKVKQHERWLQATLRSVGDAVIAIDTQQQIIFMNPVAEKLTGWKRNDIKDRKLGDIIKIIDESSGQMIENPLLRAMKEHHALELPRRALLVSRSGQHIPITDTASPIIDDNGKLLGAVLVFKDNSRQMMLEKQIRESQKMEAVGRLAGGIAHDFNNLLMVILGNTEFAKENADARSELFKDLEKVEKAAIQARELIDQLLTFSRRKSFKKEIIQVNTLINDFLKMVKRLIGEQIQIETNLDTHLHSTSADPIQIHQILMNLCLNAKDAMPGGGTLRIVTENSTFGELQKTNPKLFPQNGYQITNPFIKISISDTGKGIDLKHKDRIFEPFFSTKDFFHGTGLGLAVVYGIVQQHGGYIDVDSTPGTGTQFSIYLPAATKTGVSEDGRSKPATTAKTAGLVLVVEDDEAVRKTTVRILKVLGYEVIEAKNGREAIGKFKQFRQRISAVVLDVAMPEMSGPELYVQLLNFKKSLPTVFVTGYDIYDAVKLPANGTRHPYSVLRKPFTKDTLGAKIREALETA